MFGVSFSELILVGLVALLVLGPERLPGAARTAGLWIGRLKRSFNTIKQEVERELGADEIRRQLHNEHILSLEQEARKIFAPLTPPGPTVTPAEPPLPLAAEAAPLMVALPPEVPSPSQDALQPHVPAQAPEPALTADAAPGTPSPHPYVPPGVP